MRQAGRRGRAGALLALVVLAVPTLAAGCGIPVDDAPRPTEVTLAPRRSAVTATAPSAPTPGASRIALVDRSGRLVLVPRTSSRDDRPGAVAGLLAALTAGPTSAERDAGLTSAIPVGAALRLVDLRGGVAHVDIGGPDPDAEADQLPMTVGQIVVTVDGAPGVSAVRLTRRGSTVQAPLPGGALSGGPLTAGDYASLLRR